MSDLPIGTNTAVPATTPPQLGQLQNVSVAAPRPTTPDNGLGKDAFLKLLVAQLKYQDPMKPADSNEFMAQTAQFTMVEKLDELVKQHAAGAVAARLSLAASVVGRQVTFVAEDGSLKTGAVESVKLGDDGTTVRVLGREVAIELVRELAPAPVTAQGAGPAGTLTSGDAPPTGTGPAVAVTGAASRPSPTDR
jgi:flagellar basal-body rod modification protein FlgD